MLSLESVQNVTVVHFDWAALVEESEINAIRQQLQRLVKTMDKPRLIVDLSNVQRVSSSLVSTLVAVHQQAVAAGGQFAICGVKPDLAKVLRLTGLDKLLKVYPGELEAVQSLGALGLEVAQR
jgi:anti-anti-sigma factor